ncbi:LysR family transcriptional regulator [Klebsiella quasipneumoniae]|nr:LysR family transcriptional regulator [Klebsiella quasipneumoniae]
MDLKILRYFLTVSNTNNITKAADLLHITQPTLSRQLIMLEQSLGVELFEKNGRAMTLTAEGKLLKGRARDILDLAALTIKELTEKNVLVSGEVTIGIVESQGSELLLDLIKPFSLSYPNVRFNFYSGVTEYIIKKMDEGEVDICVLLDPVDTLSYNVIRLPTYEEWGVLLAVDDLLAKKEKIEMKDLIHQPLMLPARPSVINEIENWFGRSKYHINILGTYNSLVIPIQSVRQGICYVVCIDSPLVRNVNGLTFRQFNPIRRTQSLVLWKKGRIFNTATDLFVKTISRYLNQPEY